jgi:hypothetical protein
MAASGVSKCRVLGAAVVAGEVVEPAVPPTVVGAGPVVVAVLDRAVVTVWGL